MANSSQVDSSTARDAVLVPSTTVPDSAVKVSGIDFNHYRDRDVTVAELINEMSSAGFQSSAVADAVRIVDGMVSRHRRSLIKWLICYHVDQLEGRREWPRYHHLLGIHLELDIVWTSGNFEMAGAA